MKKVIAAVVAVVLVAFAAGVVGIGGSGGGSIKIEVDVGQTFNLNLDANPTTGYQWQLESFDESVLELVGHEYLPKPACEDCEVVVGVGGVEFWTFDAVGAGETEVNLQYVGPDGGVAETQTFVVVVRGESDETSEAIRRVETSVGQTLTLVLESNPSTGFSWQLASISDPTVLELVGHEFQASEAMGDGEPIVGAPGKEHWTFKALRAGESTIYMEYRGPSGETAQTFVVTVVVEGGGAAAPVAGNEVEVSVGSLFTLTLESNPSTGFSWQLASISDPTVLELVGHEFRTEAMRDGEPVVGASGREYWTFRALNVGESTISMEYSQPWEGGTKAAQTMVLNVVVK